MLPAVSLPRPQLAFALAMELILKALLSGLFAGVVAIAVTRCIEVFGGTLGAILATTPSTVIAASLGLASVYSGQALRMSLFSVAPGMCVNAGFLAVWKYLPPRLPPTWSRVKTCLVLSAASLSVWAVGALFIVYLSRGSRRDYGTVQATGYAACAIAFCIGLFICLSQPLQNVKGTNKVPLKHVLLRGVMASCAIAVAVLIASLDEVAAGLTSTFPAIFLTTQVSLFLQQTSALTMSSIGPMIMGSVSVGIYAILFALFTTQSAGDDAGQDAPTMADNAGLGLDNPALTMNPFLAVLASWTLSVVCFSTPVAFFLRWRRAQCEKQQAAATTAAAAVTAVEIPAKGPESAFSASAEAPHVFEAETAAAARLSQWEHHHQLSIKSRLEVSSVSVSAGAGAGFAAAETSEIATPSSLSSLSNRDDEKLLPST